MAEYIEREAAYEKCGWYNTVNGKSIYAATKGELASVPSADVAPVRHERWITTSGQAFPWSSQLLCYFHKHEECGFQYVDMKENGYNFCPYCGCIMDLED